MNYRRLGRTGLVVSEVGFGAWGIGGQTDGLTSYGKTDDAVSLAALRRALDAGITFVDTSCVYGYGHSEELIGEAFKHDRDRVVIATKTGYTKWTDQSDFSPEVIRQSLDMSLQRLKSDYVDLLQLHNPKPSVVNDPAVSGVLNDIVRAGKARAWGVSMRSPAEALEIMQHPDVGSVQVNLNMMDVRAVDSGLLDAAAEKDIGIIARTPLCFGFLTGTITKDTVFPPGDHRNGWSPAQIQRWIEGANDLHTAAAAPGDTHVQVALRFCLSFPSVASVIPGILTPAEIDENASAGMLGPLPPEALEAILTINRQQSFFVTA